MKNFTHISHRIFITSALSTHNSDSDWKKLPLEIATRISLRNWKLGKSAWIGFLVTLHTLLWCVYRFLFRTEGKCLVRAGKATFSSFVLGMKKVFPLREEVKYIREEGKRSRSCWKFCDFLVNCSRIVCKLSSIDANGSEVLRLIECRSAIGECEVKISIEKFLQRVELFAWSCGIHFSPPVWKFRYSSISPARSHSHWKVQRRSGKIPEFSLISCVCWKFNAVNKL